MRVESINDTLRPMAEPLTSIRIEGSFIILRHGLLDVIYNDQGRQVFTLTLDPPPVGTPMTFRQRVVAAFKFIFIFSKEQ